MNPTNKNPEAAVVAPNVSAKIASESTEVAAPAAPSNPVAASKPVDPAEKKGAAAKKSAVKPADSTKPARKAGGKRALEHDPTTLLKKSASRQTEAAGSADPQVKRDLRPVPAQEARLKHASGELNAASQRVDDAEVALEPLSEAVAQKVQPLIVQLRLSPAGRDLLARVKVRAKSAKAPIILERLPAGALGLPASQVAELKASVKELQPAVDELTKAKKAKDVAAKKYVRAAGALEAQLGFVWSSLVRTRVAARLAKKAS